ncbi:MAG: class I SAM-dependent methyltransferase [Candidatus Woesebacteria bacterium]
MSTFSYPDRDDAITATFVQREDSWAEDEAAILEYARSYIKDGKVLVDAGCGFGRLIPEFAPYFEKIIAIEPDGERIGKAKQTVDYLNLNDKVEFLNRPIEDVSVQDIADCVLSSHIIQHISNTAVPRVLRKMCAMLKPEGVLILTTNGTREEEDQFSSASLQEGELVEETIQKIGFELLVASHSGSVPVHKFSSASLQDLLETAGFEVLEEKPFHSGTDVLAIAKKR